MKQKLLNILAIAFIISTIGLLVDQDYVHSSIKNRFGEFLGMVTILFAIFSIIYFTSSFIFKQIQKN